MDRPDLALYAARLGYHGDFSPTLATLQALHRLHPQAIAFENLSPLAGEVPALDLPALEHKLLRQRRGGWCFEHNLLFAAVLQEIGLNVTNLAARVLWRDRPRSKAARSHMLLSVEAGGERWLADVGFGGLCLTAPLRFIADQVQETPHEAFVLRPEGGELRLFAQLPQGEAALYSFDLTPQLPIDYAYANWYLATHPDSHFLSNLFAARSADTGRHALLNGEYSWRPRHGEVQRRHLADVRELRTLLDETFGIELNVAVATDARLAPLLHTVQR